MKSTSKADYFYVFVCLESGYDVAEPLCHTWKDAITRYMNCVLEYPGCTAVILCRSKGADGAYYFVMSSNEEGRKNWSDFKLIDFDPRVK